NFSRNNCEMDELKKKKQFGLILQGKNKKEVTAPVVRPAIFGDEEEEEKIDVTGSSRSVTALRTLKQAERQHELAKAEDPSIFDYDANYEEDERLKSQKMADQKAKDEVRASKYAEAIMLSHQRRELERVSREERQQQKEREAENGEFADKEVFVTGAYRKQMEEVAKLREEEAYEARFNAMTAVEKQKVWQAGLSRTLLNDIARDGGEQMKKEDKTEKKERNTRKRLDSDDEKEKEEESKSEKKEVKKKSIYDSDPEEDGPPHKNFSGELKAGLNKVNKKTKSQVVKDRMFTPTPPSSDDEGKGRRRRSPSPRRDDRGRTRRDSSGDRRDDRRSYRRDDRRADRRDDRDRRDKKDDRKERSPKREEKKVEEKKRVKDTAELKAERFEKLKEIVKKRNGPEQIDEFRARYFERKASGFVTIPV
ncbi:ccdc-55, partial [Pristionchus pacificus]|uniref:Nuclear speckle splicing regulatory protein 1 N-terminal domain-containing protein n=1 Tax=Pristionchus pacificus TaxID=54126 RepID=A0A8R1YHY7_PRIPA